MPRQTESSCSITPSTSQGLFKLPIEIRQQIYRLVLYSATDIFVSSLAFKRRKRHDDNQTGKFVCAFSGHPRQANCCRQSGMASLPSHPSHRAGSVGSPNSKIKESGKKLRLDLLRTCCLIHLEASTIFYAENVFHFEDANAAHALRWSSSHAIFIRKIHIVLCAVYQNYDNSSRRYKDRSWLRYLEAERFSLNKDFPNLKHLAITLGRGLEVTIRWSIDRALAPFRRYLRVSIFEIVGLNDKQVLPTLGIIVRPRSTPEECENSIYKVQSSVSEYKEMVGWVNAIFWWGRDGEETPVEPRRFAGDSRYRRRLYLIGDSSTLGSYMTVGESFLEPGSS